MIEVLFNLHWPDVFAASNGNVSFYNIVEEYDEERKTAKFETILFLSKNADINTDIKCIAWHPSLDYCDIIAFGQSNGRVSLQSAGIDTKKPHLTGEYIPKHSRPCNGLAWNKFSPHFLAIGLEKSRSGSLIIWDVNSKTDLSQSAADRGKSGLELNPSPNSQSLAKPLLELASGESLNSLAWLTQETVIAGFNKKILRIYDIRSPLGAVSSSSINHKATYGICVDPSMDNRIACYGNMFISLWDSRKFSKPTASFATHQSITKIEWSPVRSGMLAALLTTSQESSRVLPDNDTVFIYDMMNATSSDQELEVSGYQPILRTVKPKMPVGEWITGFAWFPAAKNRLLTASNIPSFRVSHVSESISVCWRRANEFALSQGFNTVLMSLKDEQFSAEGSKQPSKDICSIIYRRVKNSYGLLEDSIDKNVGLSLEPDNKSLHLMWRWIHRMKLLLPPSHLVGTPKLTSPQSPGSWSTHAKSRPISVARHLSIKQEKPAYFSGVQNILNDPETGDDPNKTTMKTISWIGVAATKSKVYTSRKRNVALLMCDWGDSCSTEKGDGERFGRNSIGEGLVRRLQVHGATERACAIALWHLDMKLAIEVLNLAAKNASDQRYATFSAVAMALSGYTGSNCPTLWLDTCRNLQKKLDNPYLQMAFSFLVACSEDIKSGERGSGKFDLILSNKDLLLQDRIAFACLYLPDVLLNTFINSLADNVVSKGMLDGLLLVGLSTDSGVALLQKYIDNTGDLQTPLVAIVHTYQPSVLQRNHDVQHWKSSYRLLLNKWKLYFERVDFDILWTKASEITKTSAQVYMHCNYCNENVSNAAVQPASRNKAAPSETPPSTSLQPPCYLRHNSDPSYRSRFPGPFQKFYDEEKLRGRGQLNFILIADRQRHYSGPSLTPRSPVRGRGRGIIGGGLGFQSSITSCPSCRRPLPRCSVCSMHLGTRRNETDFTKWISWCMKCRHGGHQGHLKEWFEVHIRCPVTDCNCCCMASTRSEV